MEDQIKCYKCEKIFKYKKALDNHIFNCTKDSEIENEDYVVCKICNKKLKEINIDHLRLHEINKVEYKMLYPTALLISKKSSNNKNVYKNLTLEMSEKLKFSHTLDGYIQKYGDQLGTEKFNIRSHNIAFARSKEYYIQKYGDSSQTDDLWISIQLNKGITLQKYHKKFGKIQGDIMYNNLLQKRKYYTSIDYFIKQYGISHGEDIYFSRLEKMWRVNRKIPPNQISDFKLYLKTVYKMTRQICRQFPDKIKELSKRNRKNHLDHKISILYGFQNNIDPRYIGSYLNLEVIPNNINCSKQSKCSLEFSQLKSLVDIELLQYNDFNVWWNSPDLFYKR